MTHVTDIFKDCYRDIEADRFAEVAARFKLIKVVNLGLFRQLRARLFPAIYNHNPAFLAEQPRLAAWLRAEPEWRAPIERVADDPRLLPGKVHAALDSLRVFVVTER